MHFNTLLGTISVFLVAGPLQANTPPPVILPPCVGGQLTDNGLNGFDQVSPGSSFAVGGANQSVIGTKELQGIAEFDLATPAIHELNLNAIRQVTLTLPPRSFGSTGFAPRLTGIAAGYIGDGLLSLSDANQGASIASFTIYGQTVPFPAPTQVLDVTSFVLARLTAGDRFAGFNLRAEALPPVPHAVYDTYANPILTFYLPEPSSLALGIVVWIFAAPRKRRCRQL